MDEHKQYFIAQEDTTITTCSTMMSLTMMAILMVMQTKRVITLMTSILLPSSTHWTRLTNGWTM